MNSKTLKTLEFNKIADMLSECAVMEITKKRCLDPEICDNVKKVNTLQNETAQSITLVTKKGSAPIKCTGDVRPSLKRAHMGGVLSPGEILLVGKVLETAEALQKYPDDIECDALSEHFEALYTDRPLRKRIAECIIDADTISDNASPELADIRRHLVGGTNKIRDILHKIISSPTYQKCLQEQIITMRGDRYVVPVKSEYRNEIKGILHDSSSSGATLFIEPMSVVEENNRIRELKSKEKDEIEKILMALTEEIASVSKLVEMTFHTISELDYCFARAKFALKTDSFRPVINDVGRIDLRRARHPLLDAATVVPTDIRLGKDFDTLVVTGPNTGGKTVVLKTIGLLTLMVQAGLHIPANEGSEVGIFKNIFADIGDEQSIEQSLSTFSSHMVNIVEILKYADENSLCLFDELGAGTDPIEGASLAMSILERVRLLGAKTAATTHYSELKTYAMSTKRVENASCEFNVDTLRPTYRLLIGIPGKSNAFAISQRLGLDEDIINNAKNYIDAENVKFEDILTDLEKNRQKAQEEREKATAYKRETERIKTDTALKNKQLTEKSDKIIERARMEAKEILEKSKQEADEILRQMRSMQQEADKAKMVRQMEEARQKLAEKANAHSAKLSKSLFASDEKYKSPKTVSPGQDVELVSMHQSGTVLSQPDANGNFQVRVGIMKLTVNLKDVRIKKEEKVVKKKSKSSGGQSVSKTMSLSSELDVRGETVDSAVLLIDKFLDDALLSSLGQVRIIHGKGTGQLRQGIHSYLKRLSYVKSYRLGVFGEGDSGVTIVEFK
ncbi:MAG: endonuclease MutS2 [Ruminococcaceae bacterium]|nr:endonuclease MutS2 [Oscillospiraceae bacterium]